MNMRNPFRLLVYTIISAGFSGCAGGEASSSVPEVLSSYLQQQVVQKDSLQNKYSAYFDLSDGMLSAYTDPVTKENLKSIVNKITGNTSCEQVYALKNGVIENLDLNQTELYNYVLTPASYAKIAPIEEALKQIVSDNKSAFLVTDFEEYSNGIIQQQNYAKKYFMRWLDKGYDISFYVMDYTEGEKQKHLYFTVFDSANGALSKDIANALEGNQVNYKLFNLGTDFVTYEYNYLAETRGGCYHDATSNEDIVSCTNESGSGDCFTLYKAYQAEFYPFEASWTDIVANAKSVSDEGNTPVYTHLITGPVADFTAMSGFDVQELTLKTSNIQKDFGKFSGYYDYKKLGANADEEGKILPEFDYSKGGVPAQEVADMFIYEGTVEKGKATLNIDFTPTFTGQIAGVESGDMLRIDVVIKESQPKYELIDQLFAWEGNASLSQSVKNTLQDINPKGKVIYTFYVRAF